MFFHHFRYTLKTLFKNNAMIFWAFVFPILLATFFQMAFSDIENKESFHAIDIAIVDNHQINEQYQNILEELADENSDHHIFNIDYVSLKEAQSLLENQDITGYLYFENEQPQIVVAGSGVNETVLRYGIDQIQQSFLLIEEKTTHYLETTGDMQQLESVIEQFVQDMNNYVFIVDDQSASHMSYTMIEFYTLIAMACLYGGLIAMTAINFNLANMSSQGKRISIAPTHKLKVVFSSFLASYIVTLIGLCLLFGYMIFILNVDFSTHFLHTIILTLTGALAGTSTGLTVGTCVKQNESTKTGVLMSVVMFGCFLSGMMGIQMKYLIDKNFPIINQINPANMITDGFYSLYYYPTFDRFYFNVLSLVIFTMVMLMISFIGLRRQKYDSI